MAANPLIEEHLGKISAELKVRGRYRDRVVDEIRAHLEACAVALGRERPLA